jgi:TAT-translocated FGD2 family F420-dependent dehydrogenase
VNFERRTVLKAAALSVCASALGRVAARAADPPAMPESAGESGPGALRRGMLGFMLGHEQFRVPELVELGVAAERAGFDLIAASDHFQPWQANEGHSGEAWVTLAALGQRTSRVWMGTTVTCPTLRYPPAVVAEAFASLAWLTPGRVFLGVGSGEALNEEAATGQWPQWAERSERLVEATDVIRRLWTGEPVDHRGKYYAVDAKLYDPPPHPIPILMAGNSGKALERCGRYADGLITDPGTWKRHRARFEAGAKAAGKNPADMPVLVEQFVTVGTRDDAARAAELWRFLPKAFKSYFEIRDPQAIEARATAELPIEKVIADWIVSPDPAEHAEKIAALFRAGATIVNVHSGQPDQKRVIELYGREVLPKVAPRAAASAV